MRANSDYPFLGKPLRAAASRVCGELSDLTTHRSLPLAFRCQGECLGRRSSTLQRGIHPVAGSTLPTAPVRPSHLGGCSMSRISVSESPAAGSARDGESGSGDPVLTPTLEPPPLPSRLII